MPYINLESKVFLALLLLVSLAFGWILQPLYGALFWAVILAILFSPIHRRLLRRFSGRANLASLCTVVLCLLIAVLPMIFVTGLLVQEGATLYHRIDDGQLDVGAYLNAFRDALPPFLRNQLDRLGLSDLSSLRDTLMGYARQASQYMATKAFSFGQGTFEFLIAFGVMLYLLFFFIRDGRQMVLTIKRAIPLSSKQKDRLMDKFARVVRATVKGNIVVALTQGALGGLIFWILGIPSVVLWAVVMAFLSLLPAVGAGLIWTPVAIYFLLNDAVLQGVILILYGVLVIGLVDNVLRPILVGKDTKLPDYVVLLSTLGGLSLFGLNGFVIGPLVAALFFASWGLFVDPEDGVIAEESAQTPQIPRE